MRIVSFLLILGLLTPIAFAEVNERLDYQYYDVILPENQSLLLALNHAAPIKRDGKEYHGYTKWDVRWNFRWNPDHDGMCRIISSSTTIRGTILLPRLVSATEAHRQRFDIYVAALLEHERGHYQTGKDAAKAIDEQISSLPAASNCRELEKSANSSAYQTLEEFKKIEREYDTTTLHGKTQGAWIDD